MEATRFYPVAYDARNNPKVLMLRALQGGIVAYGRFHVLLALLYDQHGRIDMKKAGMSEVLQREMELSAEELEAFVCDCIDCGLLSAEAWEQWHVIMSESVLSQLEYSATKAKAGKMGAEARKAKKAPDKTANSRC